MGSEVNITRRVSELNTLFSREPDDGTLWVKLLLLICISRNAYLKKLLEKSIFFSKMIDKVIHNLIFGFEYYIKFTFKVRKVPCIVK